MEPTNHPFGKENDLPNLYEDMFHVNLHGCTFMTVTVTGCGGENQMTKTLEVVGPTVLPK